MKYNAEQFEVLVKDLPKILNHYGLNNKPLEEIINNSGLLNTLHYKVFQQKNYSNDNANVIFVKGERLLPLDESFKLYPDNCTDDNIETAMKKALRIILK